VRLKSWNVSSLNFSLSPLSDHPTVCIITYFCSGPTATSMLETDVFKFISEISLPHTFGLQSFEIRRYLNILLVAETSTARKQRSTRLFLSCQVPLEYLHSVEAYTNRQQGCYNLFRNRQRRPSPHAAFVSFCVPGEDEL